MERIKHGIYQIRIEDDDWHRVTVKRFYHKSDVPNTSGNMNYEHVNRALALSKSNVRFGPPKDNLSNLIGIYEAVDVAYYTPGLRSYPVSIMLSGRERLERAIERISHSK